MPTMKEIAEALMIGAVNTSMLADDVEDEKLAAKLELEVKLLQYLANQLEHMRCETCEYYKVVQLKPILITYPMNECVHLHIENFGPNFCCIHHKFKELRYIDNS